MQRTKRACAAVPASYKAPYTDEDEDSHSDTDDSGITSGEEEEEEEPPLVHPSSHPSSFTCRIVRPSVPRPSHLTCKGRGMGRGMD